MRAADSFNSGSKGSKSNHVALFRDELRRGDATSPTATLLVATLHHRLLRHCDRLSSFVSRQVSVSGGELAADAWEKTLEYLISDKGDQIADDEHLERFLRVTARRLLLDHIDRAKRRKTVRLDATQTENETDGQMYADRLPDPSPTPEELLIPVDNRYLHLIELLFRAPHRFHAICRQKNQRHPRQYQALVLYQLGMYLLDAYRREAAAGSDRVTREQVSDEIHFIQSFVELFSIRSDHWKKVETAVDAMHRAGYAADAADGTSAPLLLESVNVVCKTTITRRSTLNIYRTEMNRFVRLLPDRYLDER